MKDKKDKKKRKPAVFSVNSLAEMCNSIVVSPDTSQEIIAELNAQSCLQPEKFIVKQWKRDKDTVNKVKPERPVSPATTHSKGVSAEDVSNALDL